ncbi:MAG TPA: cytochrome C [Geobacteraceae bacterium]|nr:cytochrome C [Geobacteraceae bacterium]
MARILWLPGVFLFILSCGCAMFSAWKSIPPPGGCDQCHTIPINSQWTVAYKTPILSDERNRDFFQTPEYNQRPSDQPVSSLETRKVEDQKCFACHKSPDTAHKSRMGRYHHM